MRSAVETAQVIEALEKAICECHLPPKYSTAGKKLLSDLQTALQITFVGQDGSGKTSLINMMIGENALPQLSFGRIIDLEYGPVDQTIVEYDDGTLVEHAGVITDPERPEDVFRIVIRRPFENLRFHTYTEVRLIEADASTDALLDLVAQNSTITIWCSETFDESDQRLWSAFPNHVKDRGFLALTMADRQIMKGALESNLERLDDFASQEFFDVFPVAVLQALKARQDSTETGRELWDLSGGSYLFNTINKQLSLGREEDRDRARLLLEQLSASGTSAISIERADQQNACTPEIDVGNPEIRSSNHTLEHALVSLTRNAEEMLREADELGAFDCAGILTKCLKTVQSLSSDFGDVQSDSEDFQQLVTDMQESENMLLLFKIEEDEEATLDAVSLLIQMKKEIARRLPH